MCKVCVAREKQRPFMDEVGNLLHKRETAILMGRSNDVQEITPIVKERFEALLKAQEEMPDITEDPDLDVILCLMGARKDRKDAARRV